MSIIINGQEKRIGLSLSGGGFRAAGFHLGVFRKLEELGLLWKIDLLSCVSGGSIAGAYLALHWKETDVLDNLEKYLTTQSIEIGSIMGGILNPFESRTEALASTYKKDLYGKKTLDDLTNGPRIYLNSTNLVTGNMFFFVAGGNGKSEMGEHELGVVEAPGFRISEAVAASSAFPPVYPPMEISREEYNVPGISRVALSDGGVYDNLGVNPLLRTKRNNLDYVIVSDAGKPFELDKSPTNSSAMVLGAAIGILMEQVRGQQFQHLKWKHKAGEGPKAMWFSIDSHIGESRKNDAEISSSISTRLKRLKDFEISVLKRHGGALVYRRLKDIASELIN